MNIHKFKAVYLFLVLVIACVIGLTLLQQFMSGSDENVQPISEDDSEIVENNVDEKVVVEVQKDLFQETKGVVAEEKNSENTTSSTTSSTKTTTTKPKTATKPAPTPKPTTPTSCPATTQNCVPCNAGESYCRLEPGKTIGYLGWSCQNNNPGNIRPSTTSYPNCGSGASYDRVCIIKNNGGPAPCGKRVDSRGGEYMIFSTYADGKNALRAYLKGINNGQHKAYTGCGNCTLRFMLGKYSSNTTTYPAGVAAKLGVNADTTTLAWIITNGKLEQLIDAIQSQEGFFTR